MSNEKYQILYNDINDSERVSFLTLGSTNTVKDIKKHLTNKYGHPSSQLVLFCNDRQLVDDNKSVEEISMGDKTIEVYYRLNQEQEMQANETKAIIEENSLSEEEEESDDSMKIHTLDDFFKIADRKERKMLGKKTQRGENSGDITEIKRQFNPNMKEFLELFVEKQYPIVYKTITSQKEINQNENKVNLNNLMSSLHSSKTSISLEELTSTPEKESNQQLSPLCQSYKPLTINQNTRQSHTIAKQERLPHQPLSIQSQFDFLLQSPKWSSKETKAASQLLHQINHLQIKDEPLIKLNIIFDLDNTLIFSALTSNVVFSPNLINIQGQTEKGTFYSTFVFRRGIDHFIQSTRSFSNYFVYSLGMISYVDQIIKEFEKKFNIKIANRIGRKNNEATKDLSLLLPKQSDREMSVIIDDLNRPWGAYFIYIVNSMRFIDSFFVNNQINQFLPEDFSPLHYNTGGAGNEEWTSIRFNPHQAYFQENRDENGIPLHVEYNCSKKFQFDYLGESMRKIYAIAVHAQVTTDKAIAFLRRTTLIGCVFALDYCGSNSDILLMITTMGGEVSDSKKNNEYSITHIVVSSTLKEKYRERKLKTVNKRAIAVNAKFIFHSFYYMKKMDEKENEYQP